ncbi:hypothetical protein LEP1GSC047_3384 [Leptospira inadai serovar Lyme str. 10]|uniref:Uncharacterized protein n=2 Tax=Leptospira inadai serovar Lyme TaxID=293084 RepID=V6HHX9_9LEPT|nr:hypothetical protein [Leptospira inadai]EQA36165.1 hypothetical protein LEP1GSC047_3384 [Leptospira inadai serovar Lyme str. 10]PNV74842.1 hypothetical protein BES34_011245 [Leptospira inadai serovar Lyme]
MEFFLYLIFFAFTLSFLSLADYYFGLLFLSGKDMFAKSELTDWIRILPSKILQIFEAGGNLQYGLISFGLSAFVSYIWTLTGGLIGAPHYADSFGNYFFLSFLMPGLLLAFYPALATEILKSTSNSRPDSFLARFLGQEIPFLSGVFVSVIASNLAVYGLYHEIAFLFVLPNIAILAILLILRWNGKVRFGGIRLDRQEPHEDDFGEDS